MIAEEMSKVNQMQKEIIEESNIKINEKILHEKAKSTNITLSKKRKK
jgi:hypothetical protein